MQAIFEPILIRYDGLDADQHLIEMGYLSESLNGISRILSTSATYAATLKHVQRVDARLFRAYALLPDQHGCYEVLAVVGSIAQPSILHPLLGIAKPLYEALIAWIFAQQKKDDATVDAMKEVCVEALKQMGLTARSENEKQLEVMCEMVEALRDATKQAVQPVGVTCDQMTIRPTVPDVARIRIDRAAKETILEEPPTEVLPARPYTVLLSEIDIHTRGCRVSFAGEAEGRIKGIIADPVLTVAGDPYTKAMNERKPITVIAKAMVDAHGEIKRLVISDSVPE